MDTPEPAWWECPDCGLGTGDPDKVAEHEAKVRHLMEPVDPPEFVVSSRRRG